MRKSMTLIAALALLVIGAAPALAKGGGAEVNSGTAIWETETYVVNPCTGENVHFWFTSYNDYHDVVDGHGRLHQRPKSGELIDSGMADGWEIVDAGFHGTYYNFEGDDFSQEEVGRLKYQIHLTVEDPGSEQWYNIFQNFWWVTNANGETIVESFQRASSCKG